MRHFERHLTLRWLLLQNSRNYSAGRVLGDWESTGRALGECWESAGSAGRVLGVLGVLEEYWEHWESAGKVLEGCWESAGRALEEHWESVGSTGRALGGRWAVFFRGWANSLV